MSPIDDELRLLLRSRAAAVLPASDPLLGIERRARTIRRNRVTASVAGAALAVAAIAVAVPALVPDRDARPSLVGATPSPSLEPSPSLAPSAAATPALAGPLDPTHPWPYRGDRSLLADTASLQQEWAAVHPGSTLTPLYGEVYESSKRPQITFVSTGGGDRWGVATSSDAGWTFLHDEGLAAGTKVLMAALPADEVPRLLVVAAPATAQLEYAAHGTDWKPLTDVQPGIAYTPLQGDTSADQVRGLDGNGDIDHPLFIGPAPDFAGPTSSPSVAPSYRPSNYLEWQTRGTVDPRLEDQAVSAYAQAQGVPTAVVGHHVLWGGTDKAGRNLLFMEAWVGGGQAQTFGFVSTGEPFLGPVLGKTPDVLAYLASGAPGTGTDVLVVLPRLGAGPFSYAASATAAYQPVGNARSDLNNAAVIYRDPKASSDRLRVLGGDGIKVLYDGPVQPLLCGVSGCG